MSDAPSAERRRASRVPVAITVELRNERGFSLHVSSNLSAGGAFFGRSIPHPVGEKVKVTFSLPGEAQPITCQGEVVSVPDKKSFGMGVRFLDLSSPDKVRLDAFTHAQGGTP
ncbi:MAG TPA: PilZ domain-containing protein [Myxococcaceae bacterium]|nr:PilZ domain-containing protein [Myxococcaceae bacterium]